MNETQSKTIFQTVAEEFDGAFVADTRNNGEQFWKLRDDAPAWLAGDNGTDVMRSIHESLDGRFPDDWVYGIAAHCGEDIASRESADDARDESGEIADSLVDFRSQSLRLWVSDMRNDSLVTEAVEELGLPDPFSLDKLIQVGQYIGIERIVHAVIDAIEEEADSRE